MDIENISDDVKKNTHDIGAVFELMKTRFDIVDMNDDVMMEVGYVPSSLEDGCFDIAKEARELSVLFGGSYHVDWGGVLVKTSGAIKNLGVDVLGYKKQMGMKHASQLGSGMTKLLHSFLFMVAMAWESLCLMDLWLPKCQY